MNSLLNIYSIRDAKSETYLQPQYFNTHGEAERYLTDLVQNAPNSPVAKFPEDFDLFHLGTFEIATGLIKPLITPTQIIKALHVKKRDPIVELAKKNH